MNRESVNGGVFKGTELATPEEQLIIDKFTKECPLSVFQALAKQFSASGLCLLIDADEAVH